MRRRSGRPSLIGTMARTAVIAGTATAVSGNVQQKQMARAAETHAAAQREAQAAQQAQQSQADIAAMQAQLAALDRPSSPTEVTSSPGDALMGQLERLAQLKSSGVLTDEEFAAAKARLLGM